MNLYLIIYLFKSDGIKGKPEHAWLRYSDMTHCGEVGEPCLMPCSSEAPAKSLADNCRALTEQHGRAFAKRSLGTTGVSSKNASRQFKQLVKKFQLSVRIPVSHYIHVEGGETVSLPYLKPADVLTTMLSQYPWMFLGGYQPGESQQVLLSFWDGYQQEHPGHAVFSHDRDRLSRTIPMTFHGDVVEHRRKSPLRFSQCNRFSDWIPVLLHPNVVHAAPRRSTQVIQEACGPRGSTASILPT